MPKYWESMPSVHFAKEDIRSHQNSLYTFPMNAEYVGVLPTPVEHGERVPLYKPYESRII